MSGEETQISALGESGNQISATLCSGWQQIISQSAEGLRPKYSTHVLSLGCGLL